MEPGGGKCLRYVQTLSVFLGLVALGSVTSILGITLVDLSQLFNSPLEVTSQILTTRAVGFLFGSLLSSSVIYKYINGKICLVLTLVLGGLANAFIPTIGVLVGAHACLFIAGMSVGILEVGGNVWLVQLWQEKVAPIFQMYHLSFGVGSFLAPVVTEPYLSHRNETLFSNGTAQAPESQVAIPYGIFGGAYAGVGVFMLLLFCIDPSNLRQQEASSEEGTGIVKSKQRAYFEWLVVVHLVFYVFVQVTLESTIAQMLSVYVLSNASLRFDKSSASYLFAMFWTLYTSGRVVAMVMSFKIRPFSIILFMQTLCIFGTVLLVALGTTMGESLWFSISIMGFGLSPLYASVMSWAVRYTRLQYVHMTLVLVASCMGQMLPPLTVALWIKSVPTVFIWALGGWMVLHTANLFMMYSTSKGQPDIYEHSSSASMGENNCEEILDESETLEI
ncbi:sodium-dependent glucose transporter 1-like [Tropilaelaps mercedesae]|uniref:Sodium-dependent glucose transporter 1-like n=1 Tax=Tropilaelaps mercedesae TaxID=418985 RepID=A0A1V9XJJ6_9ACAR|nr:sodium-dependent glucose transporter 1-like [Tropilaelaps mercedesae]